MTTATVLRWVSAVGIATVAVGRCAIVFAAQIVFDTDPAIDPAPLAGLGPAGSLVLDALLLAAAGLGLLGEALDRRPIDVTLLVLAVLPAGAIWWHGAGDFGDLWRGTTWFSAAVAAATVAHLARDPALRVVLAALLLSVVVPLAVRGAAQVGFGVPGFSYVGGDQREVVREFDKDREKRLREQGLEPGSSGALVFERRLRQGDPRAWFPTSNVFAALMSFGLVASAGLTWRSWRRRLEPRFLALGLALEVICAAALLASGSKGGMIAAAAGLTLLAAGAWPRARALVQGRRGGAVALALVAAALLGVVARGTILPESLLGERSLLVRWHYMVGATRLIAAHPLPGVGPDGFQDAYTAVRLARSPEEVTSAHSALIDWLAMLGASGAAWGAMAIILLWRAGGRLAGAEGDVAPVPMHSRAPLFAGGAVAALGLVPAIAVEAHAFGGLSDEAARLVGVVGYLLVAAGACPWLRRLGPAALDASLAAATVALLVQAQIEMIFFDPSAVTWAYCCLALAGRAARGGPPRRGAGLIAGALVLGGAVVLALARTIPALKAQSMVIEAAKLLSPRGETRARQAEQREAAASLLRRACESQLPSDSWLLIEAARQRLYAAGFADGADRLTLLDAGTALADLAVERSGRAKAIALAVEAWQIRATLSNDAGEWDQAIGLARRLTEIDPHGIGPWLRLGDLLWQAGRRDEAVAAYERALESDRNRELDPLSQLPLSGRQRIQERIAKARS